MAMSATNEEKQLEWMEDAFRRCVSLYKRRGYAGTITVSGTFGIYTESIKVSIFLDDAVHPSEVSNREDPSSFIEVGDSKLAKLVRTLMQRMENRASSWNNITASEVNPILGSKGAIGVTLPIVNLGWSVELELSVYQSTLIRYMALAQSHRRIDMLPCTEKNPNAEALALASRQPLSIPDDYNLEAALAESMKTASLQTTKEATNDRGNSSCDDVNAFYL